VPRPLLKSTSAAVVTRYRPGGPDALLGGDFFDAIECPDGSLRLLIGDVCGHGPDEAALGVALRIAWRSLVLAGLSSSKVLEGLDSVFAAEQRGDALFATVCDIDVTADHRSMRVHLCGHPPPLLVEPDVRWLDELSPRPPIGLAPGAPYDGTIVPLPPEWSLLQVTDGLFEGRDAAGERLGRDGLVDAIRRLDPPEREPGDFLDRLIDDITDSHGGALPYDMALLWVDTRRGGA
jgi:serine phosphatase RsbU (regulator of sigma subunit)